MSPGYHDHHFESPIVREYKRTTGWRQSAFSPIEVEPSNDGAPLSLESAGHAASALATGAEAVVEYIQPTDATTEKLAA